MDKVKTELDKVKQILFKDYSWTSAELDEFELKLIDVIDAQEQVNVALGNVSKSFTEKQMDDAYDKGYKDGAIAENEMH
jgi:hypothetical protein